MHFWNEFKRKQRSKGINELVNDGLELEAAIKSLEQPRHTGQGIDQIKPLGYDLNAIITKSGTSWVNSGTLQKVRKMRAVTLTILSEKQRVR